MKLLALLPLYLLLSCATSPEGPATYERGTFVRPPPAPARAGVGAPMVGQPGAQSREYPRSPYTRVLPQTPETRKGPGLWSAESPRASIETWVYTADIAGLHVPHVGWDGTPAPERNPCISRLRRFLDSGTHLAELARLPKHRECIIARLFNACVMRQFTMSFGAFDADGPVGGDDIGMYWNLSVRFAMRFADETCAGGDRDTIADKLMDRMNNDLRTWTLKGG